MYVRVSPSFTAASAIHYILHQISLKSQAHQMPCQNCLPMIYYKHFYRCSEQIYSVNASLNTYQTEKYQNMKVNSFYSLKDYCTNMSQI